jgi:hypothetical protein
MCGKIQEIVGELNEKEAFTSCGIRKIAVT